MKRILSSAAITLAAVLCVCPVVQAGVWRVGYSSDTGVTVLREDAEVTPEYAALEVQKQDAAEQITLLYGSQEQTPDDMVDYAKVKVETHLRNGCASAELQILDTVVAELSGVDGVPVSYRWQGSADGRNWATIPGAVSNQYWVTYAETNKYIRCVIKTGRLTFSSDAVAVPLRKMAAPASDTSQQLSKSRENSNPDYIFHVDGKGFVMLDDRYNSDAAFYVTTTEAYGDAANSLYVSSLKLPTAKAVSAHGIYTVAADGSSIETMLTTFGNNYTFFGEDRDTTYTLPAGMEEYVNRSIAYPFCSSSWLINRNFYKSPQFHGIWMLAWDDFIKYSDRLGYKDNIFDMGGSCYFLRDGSPIEGWYANCVVTDEGKSDCIKNGIGVIRPAFFLHEEFFTNVKLDNLASTGEAVLQAMRERYSIEDLKHLYSTAELVKLGFVNKTDKEAPQAAVQKISLSGATAVTASVAVRNSSSVPQEAIIILGVRDAYGVLTRIGYAPVSVAAGGVTDAVCTVDGLSDITDAHQVTVFVFDVPDEDAL